MQDYALEHDLSEDTEILYINISDPYMMYLRIDKGQLRCPDLGRVDHEFRHVLEVLFFPWQAFVDPLLENIVTWWGMESCNCFDYKNIFIFNNNIWYI